MTLAGAASYSFPPSLASVRVVARGASLGVALRHEVCRQLRNNVHDDDGAPAAHRGIPGRAVAVWRRERGGRLRDFGGSAAVAARCAQQDARAESGHWGPMVAGVGPTGSLKEIGGNEPAECGSRPSIAEASESCVRIDASAA